MSTGVSFEAARLVHCGHTPSAVRKVVAGAPAKWCSQCGALWNGYAWIRPDAHATIRTAVHALGKLRLAAEKAAAKRAHEKRVGAKKSAKRRAA